MQIFPNPWQPPPPNVVLRSDEVHLWRVNLDGAFAPLTFDEAILSADEIARANKFRFSPDRERFVRTRTALRSILAPYTLLARENIKFCYPRNGKPELAAEQNRIGLEFNTSHSQDFAIIGVSAGRRVGVDVERYRILEFLDIARRYFSDSEYRQLSVLSPDQLQKNFFACWTRKEAFLKALGEGIGVLLPQVSITVAYSEAPKLIEFQADPDAPLQWSLIDVRVHEDYAAALAFERGPIEVRHWNFRE